MVNSLDKKVFYEKSFNEQMAWIDEEVEYIIKYNDKYLIKKDIQEKGKDEYGKSGHTHTINRLFEIIKTDPKNKALMHEICRAENELIAFLYDEPGALSERETYKYWNAYLQSYIAEYETYPMQHGLIKGDDTKGLQSPKCLGIYDSVESEKLFSQNDIDTKSINWVELVMDSIDMYRFKLDKIRKSPIGYMYENASLKYRSRPGEEMLNVGFNVKHSYEILGALDWYWGGWNNTPNTRVMQAKAKEWYEKYNAKLLRISHDTLTFQCKRLSEEEAKELIEDAVQMYALIIDTEPEDLVNYLMKEEKFTLWWD